MSASGRGCVELQVSLILNSAFPPHHTDSHWKEGSRRKKVISAPKILPLGKLIRLKMTPTRAFTKPGYNKEKKREPERVEVGSRSSTS